jgi:hypothetical protein
MGRSHQRPSIEPATTLCLCRRRLYHLSLIVTHPSWPTTLSAICRSDVPLRMAGTCPTGFTHLKILHFFNRLQAYISEVVSFRLPRPILPMARSLTRIRLCGWPAATLPTGCGTRCVHLVGTCPAIGYPHQFANDAIPLSNHPMQIVGSSPATTALDRRAQYVNS